MVGEYLESYDKNRRRVGVLIDATDIQRRRRLNSDYELSFLLPMTSDDYREKVALKGHVKDERGQYYVINSRQRVRDGKKLTAAISCSHIMFKLADFKIPYASYISEAYGVHIGTLLDTISAATNGKFTFVIHDTFDLFDVKDWGRSNALQALNDVIKMYGCEVEPDNFTLHIRKRIGADNGLQYRYRKNIVSTNFRDESSNLVTRMFAQMKDGRTWIGQSATILNDEERALLSQVSGAIVDGKLAVNYLISPYQSAWANDTNAYFDGEIIEQDIEDPVKLLEATRKALRENEVPKLEVSVSAADLFKLDNTEPKPSLGDTVTLIDEELGLDNITARITELTEYPYTNEKHSNVTVANVMTRDYIDIIADLERSKNIVDNIFSGGRIRTEVFEAFAKQAIVDVHASKTEVRYDTRGIILVDKTDNRNQVALTSNGIVVSTDGLQTARAAINSRGVVAELIVGQLGNFASMLIGSGNDVVQINTNGIAAGHADMSKAPFQVNMKGDVIARSITLTGKVEQSEITSSIMRAGTIEGTTMNASFINGGFIVGASITGGSIKSNTDIDITRDARIGNNLELNGENEMAAKSVQFTGVGSVYGDNLLKRITVYGQRGVILNGGADGVFVDFHSPANRIVTNSELDARLGEVWAELSKKSNVGHTHTVTVPNHNHGNPDNQNSGGGTFTSSS